MMKKFFSSILAVIVFALLVSSAMLFPARVAHSESIASSEDTEISESLMKTITEFSQFSFRYPGSVDAPESETRVSEKAASEYIYNALISTSGISPVKFGDGNSGVQTFEFISALDGKKYSSQNIAFLYDSESTKKIIIGTSYDAVAFGDGSLIPTQGVGQSAGSVALLLILASYLPKLNLNFDIEFVFFGAGQSNFAGSKFYTDGLSSKETADIDLMINLDGIVLGKNIYFYVDEISNKFSKFESKLSSENGLGVSEIKTKNLGKVLLDSANDLGLSYTHIAQNSDNFNFMKLKVLTMNIFSGDYSSGVVIGRKEYDGRSNLMFSANDSISDIPLLLGTDAITKNLVSTFKFIRATLTDTDFIAVCESTGKGSAFYSFFANQKLAVYLTIVAVMILILIAMIIYYKLSVKSYKADVEVQFTSSVLSISDNISDNIGNFEVPKIVSQVMANDIKKDKQIKRKKKKDDEN